MCGRAYRTTPTGDLARHFHAAPAEGLEASYNTAPTEDVAAVRLRSAEQRELFAARWGLLPPWVKDDGKRPPMLMNAKAETVADKPAFRVPFKRRRCLVVFDGFFEWRKDGKEKRPFVVRLKSHEPMAMAGLWDHNRAFDVDSTVVLTTDANDVVRDIHDRMPVILEGEEAWRAWLDPDSDEDTLRSLLRPLPPELLEVFEVSQHVNNVRHKDAACLAPLSQRESFVGDDEPRPRDNDDNDDDDDADR